MTDPRELSTSGDALTGTVTRAAVVSLRGIGKSFGSVRVLDSIDVDLISGDILALAGENGAGKSTIVRILGGIHKPDAGQLLVDGIETHFSSPLAAGRAGIAIIHQEPALFPQLTVAENVFVGHQPADRRGVQWDVMRRRTRELLAELDVSVDVDVTVSTLSTAHRQLVEIAKALSSDARVLILDEPTASLSGREVDDLFAILRRLRQRGTALAFITHRLDEIFTVADRIAVLRDGQIVSKGSVADYDAERVIHDMVGRRLGSLYPKQAAQIGEPVLRVRDLRRAGAFSGISFEVKAGEIVGLAGLVGAGRTEVARSIFGLDPVDGGDVEVAGEVVHGKHPADAIRAGLAYVPEDRRHQGLVLDQSIAHNIGLTLLRQLTRWGVLRTRQERCVALDYMSQLQIKATGADQVVATLSGGNQQKVVLGKWLARAPKVLILDEPTRGIDVGTKAEVYRLISGLAAQGLAIVLISSELPEVLGMSDRVLVMAEGKLTGEFDRSDATPELVMRAATSVVPTQRESEPEPAADARPFRQTRLPRSTLFARSLTRMAAFREGGLLLVLLAIALGVSLQNSRFMSWSNAEAILLSVTVLGVVAIGQTFVLLARNIDLSVGSAVGLTAFCATDLLQHHPGMNLALLAVVAMSLGAALGLFNGLIVSYGRVPAIVATLGTLYAYRGLAFLVAGGKQVSAADLPNRYLAVATNRWLGIPEPVVFVLVLVVCASVVLWRTRFGRRLYAIGSNGDAARLVGLRVESTVVIAFVICGVLCGFAGFLYGARFGSVDARAGQNLEFEVIAAVVVGGVSINGGVGTVIGAVLGATVLGTIADALNILELNANWLQAFSGAALLVAVTMDLVVRRRQDRRSARAAVQS